ncbi:helix-turn-helix domain-containing protein [Chloroflexota bacterium]
MSTVEKAAIMAMVETLARRKRQVLSELGIARSTYYRWRQGQCDGLESHSGYRGRPWKLLVRMWVLSRLS